MSLAQAAKLQLQKTYPMTCAGYDSGDEENYQSEQKNEGGYVSPTATFPRSARPWLSQAHYFTHKCITAHAFIAPESTSTLKDKMVGSGGG